MKTAILFGASGTIGAEIAKELSENGYALLLACREHEPEVSSLVTPYTVVKADVSKSEEVKAAFAAAEKTLSKPCLCVNASGIALPQQLLTDIPDAEIERIFAVNALGALYVSREAARAMHGLESGSIVHISSLWGSIGGSCEVPYSASKGAVNAMIKALAKELAPEHITVNAVAPGLVPSPMNKTLSPDALEAFRSDTPLGCFISPADIAKSVLYLASSQHITGQILAVDGGIVI